MFEKEQRVASAVLPETGVFFSTTVGTYLLTQHENLGLVNSKLIFF